MQQMRRRIQNVIHPVCVPHHADVADEKLFPLFESRVRRQLRVGKVRGGSYHKNFLRRLFSALQRDRPHGLVGCQHNIGTGVGQPLGQTHRPIKQAWLAKLGLKHFRPKIVHVINHANAKQFEGPRHQEQQVRGVAEVNNFESVPPPGPPGQSCLSPKRRCVLAKESDKPTRFSTDPVPVNLNSLRLFFRLRVTAHLRTDHHDLVAGVAQRAGLLPHPAIERHRQILDDDEDRGLAHLRLAIGDLRG